MCGCEDGEEPEFWHEEWRTARKPHRCYECPRGVRVGERYQRITGKWDGSLHTYIICPRCVAFREAWHDVEGCWALLGAIREEIIPECFGQMRRDPPEEREEEDGPSPQVDPECLLFGIRLRTHLGKYGPQLPRRAA